MPHEQHLERLALPELSDATMLLALNGWMDGGFVSTGTVRSLMADREAPEIARIKPDPFYLYNFPGSMEIAALFRPTVKYEAGLVTEFDFPTNTFHADPASNLVFFIGKEPNLLWQDFADCIFHVARETGVKRIIFMGSFGGSVPHTREPRLFGSVSHERLKRLLDEYALRPSDYEGPGSFATLLLSQSESRGVEMLSLVAEIPGYLEGINPTSIEAISRRLAKILNLPLNLDRLRRATDDWEARVTEAVDKDPKLAATIRKLEHRYDNELIGTENEDEEDDEQEEDAEEHDEEKEDD